MLLGDYRGFGNTVSFSCQSWHGRLARVQGSIMGETPMPREAWNNAIDQRVSVKETALRHLGCRQRIFPEYFIAHQGANMKRRFEFSEGGSQKFWEVELVGPAFTVTYGRLGTAGQSKTTTCGSADEAIAEVGKLVREKTKKGYQEVGAAERNWRPPAVYGLHGHVSHFMNFAVADFNHEADGEGGDGEDDSGRKTYPTLRDAERRAYAIHATFDDAEEVPLARFQALLQDPKAAVLKGLVLGNWWGEVCENGPLEFVKLIAENPSRFAGLVGIFSGDVTPEESEISWLNQCDWSPALQALPGLEEFVVRGGPGLRFPNLRHASLRSLTVQSGGLGAETIRDIAAADLPELRNLTIWLGCDSYGGTYTVEDVAPILAGTVFPQLEFLGLMNSDQADAIAIALSTAPILGRLKGLDLSMGTLSDKGGLALLQHPQLGKLKYLNLRHHYLSPAVIAKFKKLGIELNIADAELGDAGEDDEDDEDRYCEVTE